jgi:hypothetical protein
LWL